MDKQRKFPLTHVRGSTMPNHNAPLFTQTPEIIPMRQTALSQPREDAEFPNAIRYYENAIKLPVWALPSDRQMVLHYINTFKEVAQRVMSNDKTFH